MGTDEVANPEPLEPSVSLATSFLIVGSLELNDRL